MVATFPRSALEGSIPARFAEQVALHPDRLAVLADDGTWTYAELDRRSAGVAAAVAAGRDVGSEPVLVHMEQGAWLVATVLGVLRAGKAAVLVDPASPAELKTAIASEVGATLAVASPGTAAAAQALVPAEPRSIDGAPTAHWQDPALGPELPACIHPIVGPSGRTQLVVDTHRTVLHDVMRTTNALGIAAGDRVSLLDGPGGVEHVPGALAALLNGACTCPYDLAAEGVDGVGPWLERAGVTVLRAAPELFRRALAEPRALPTLRLVGLEGEGATPEDLELLRAQATSHPAPGVALAVPSARADRSDAEPRPAGPAGEPLVQLNQGGRRPSLVLLHELSDASGATLRRLAELLGPEQPVVVVCPTRLGVDAAAPVEAHARAAHARLRAAGVQAPLALAGIGRLPGLVAYALACELERAGSPPTRLVLVGTPCAPPQSRHLRRAVDLLGAVAAEDAAATRRRYLALRRALVERPSGDAARPASQDAVDAYAPGRYGGRLDLVWPRHEPGEIALHRWPRLARATRTTVVPGTVATALADELHAIGAAIRAALA